MRKALFLLVSVFLTACASSGENQLEPSKANAAAKARTELAASYYERMQYAIALQELELAMRADADYAPAYNVRALIYMALREDEKADSDFRRSLRIDESNSEAHNNYGWFLCQRGRIQESLKHFKTALENPLYATPEMAYLNQGLCAKQAGMTKEAEQSLQRALLLHPSMPEAIIAMADLRFQLGDFAGAKTYLLRFIQQGRELNAEQLWLAIRIERKMRDRNSAASYALQLHKRFPDSREAQLLSQGE
jgi:type IV pilus assembly protein PilF